MIGKGSNSYDRAGMAQAIANNKYHLQYALYAAALHLYMKACKGDDWNYERDFGGCHYLFLRSFGEVEGTGDFNYRPSWNHIKTILETLGHSNVRA
jgi:exodeoxyribonuclease V beta subunit